MRNFHWKKVDGVPQVDYDNQLVINDTIEVNVDMVTLQNGEWVPLNIDDLQIEFKLVDPVIVKYFKRVENGKYSFTSLPLIVIFPLPLVILTLAIELFL